MKGGVKKEYRIGIGNKRRKNKKGKIRIEKKKESKEDLGKKKVSW